MIERGGEHDNPRRSTTRSLLEMPFSESSPQALSTSSNVYPYSVIIISYHKTGVSFDWTYEFFLSVVSSSFYIIRTHKPERNATHPKWYTTLRILSRATNQHDLQMDLVDYVVNEFPDVGPRLTEFGNKSPKKRRRHPANIPCTRIGSSLRTGTISVQHAWVRSFICYMRFTPVWWFL